MWHVGPITFWLTQGLPTLSWAPTLEPSLPKPVPFWVLQEKQLQKYPPEHFFVAGINEYFPNSFWWFLSVLLPYWEEISFCLRNLAAIAVLLEDVLKLFHESELFYQPPSETTPEWERPFVDVWSKDPQISISADGKFRPDYVPLWGS